MIKKYYNRGFKSYESPGNYRKNKNYNVRYEKSPGYYRNGFKNKYVSYYNKDYNLRNNLNQYKINVLDDTLNKIVNCVSSMKELILDIYGALSYSSKNTVFIKLTLSENAVNSFRGFLINFFYFWDLFRVLSGKNFKDFLSKDINQILKLTERFENFYLKPSEIRVVLGKGGNVVYYLGVLKNYLSSLQLQNNSFDFNKCYENLKESFNCFIEFYYLVIRNFYNEDDYKN